MTAIIKELKGYKITSIIALCSAYIIYSNIHNIYFVILGLLILFISGLGEFLFNKFSESNKIEKIKGHSCFIKIEELLLGLRAVKFAGNSTKNIAFKDYLTIFFFENKKHIEKCINERKNNILCSGSCGYIIIQTKKSIQNINEIARKIGLPEIFIDVFMAFFQKHLDIFLNVSDSLCQDRCFKYCSQKTFAHLANIEFLILLVFEDITSAGKLLNSTLEFELEKCNYLEKRKEFIKEYDLIRIN